MRSKAQIVLEKSNKSLGNLTDKQIEQYISESHKKQNKKRQSKGGITAGNSLVKSKKGLFAMNEESKNIARTNGGYATSSLPIFKDICSLGGKASAKSPKHPNNTLVKCPYCNKESNLAIMKRWHFDNCKLKK
jgi:hypothetical protein